ncbi:hypothetical protein PVAND_007034 [Polypedilum vanderplanki]|uniref:Peptidase M14 domain-containing protein n=1 Tax=Polypedilum vanderplanki TaxID=319348 RepID=A0A9J6C5K3_POLVA|nr:hypothetical protein PVAND_007034 [Polypedilum vanderplanki]
MRKFLVFIVLIQVCFGYETYRNYKVYDMTPTNEQHEALANWQNEVGVDFWRFYAPERTSRVMIAPDKQEEFEAFLVQTGIKYEVAIHNMEDLIISERQNITRNRRGRSSPVQPGFTPDFSVYWTADEMEQYCTYLAHTYPNLVQIETLLFSPNNRRIYALKVSNGVFGQKPIIAMEGGMHAREWASPPTVLYLLHKLVEDSQYRNELLANVDWLIVPMDNPDGYEHSRLNARLWRQNRRQVTPTCVGVDINRNFGYSWRTATVACGSQTYPGPSSLSEPESFALHTLLERYASRVKLYLSVHTFGDMVLWPWGYSGSPGWISTHEEHQALGVLWRDGILAQGGRNYIVGNVADVLGNAFGAVDDHMAGHYGIPYVYTLELTSGFQFQYPEARIGALAAETFWGYRAMALHIGEKFS